MKHRREAFKRGDHRDKPQKGAGAGKNGGKIKKLEKK
jgi:hypothetical protein